MCTLHDVYRTYCITMFCIHHIPYTYTHTHLYPIACPKPVFYARFLGQESKMVVLAAPHPDLGRIHWWVISLFIPIWCMCVCVLLLLSVLL